MANAPGLVARIFNRGSKHAVVTKLFTHAIGQPLLVHPPMGQALIGAYLSGAVDVPDQLVDAGPAAATASGQTQAGTVRVLNISGALVNRPMPDACGPGPLSYEQIGEAFDAAMADENVAAIVMRMSSPGGMAAGLFDLTDQMFAQRGKKPVYAMVDDYAFSACYGLAAVADEIWVTRTGGVGSVGVVAWHQEQSGYDAKIGVKVTPIFSGDHKVDFSQHAPLSADAQAGMQAEVDRLRALFVDRVSTYRGVGADVIQATEAAIYFGPTAVSAGMADKVGTMRDLLAYIAAPKVETETPAEDPNDLGDGDGNDDPLPEDKQTAGNAGAITLQVSVADTALGRKGALAIALAASNLAPDLVKALLSIPEAPVDLEARIQHAQAVADLCTAAGLREAAPGYVSRNTDVEQVRTELAAAVAVDPLPQLVTALPTGVATGATSTMHNDIYSRRRVAAAGNGK